MELVEKLGGDGIGVGCLIITAVYNNCILGLPRLATNLQHADGGRTIRPARLYAAGIIMVVLAHADKRLLWRSQEPFIIKKLVKGISQQRQRVVFGDVARLAEGKPCVGKVEGTVPIDVARYSPT